MLMDCVHSPSPYQEAVPRTLVSELRPPRAQTNRVIHLCGTKRHTHNTLTKLRNHQLPFFVLGLRSRTV
eukprot:5967462-Amphidinium_carterae.1